MKRDPVEVRTRAPQLISSGGPTTGNDRRKGRSVKRTAALLGHALTGWAVCGATVAIGRQVISMDATLLVHAVVAGLAFGFLAWHYSVRYPDASALGVSLTMLSVVVGLDALVVAPFLERSYAMFRSVLGTWVPFALIFAASYIAAHLARQRAGQEEGGGGGAAPPRG